MNKKSVMPVIVLPLICLFVSGTLSICNSFTQPVIDQAAARRVEIARRDIMPRADGFESLELPGLPKAITAVYREINGTGFIFLITTMGYGGEMKLICGIDPDGTIIKTATLSQVETKGITGPVFEEPYQSQYIGKDSNLNDVAAVSGATISSTAYKKGIREAFTAFTMVVSAGGEL